MDSALPILRQLGSQRMGSSLLRSVWEGDTSMLKVWVGLEARKYLQNSADLVSIWIRHHWSKLFYMFTFTGGIVREIRPAVSQLLEKINVLLCLITQGCARLRNTFGFLHQAFRGTFIKSLRRNFCRSRYLRRTTKFELLVHTF